MIVYSKRPILRWCKVPNNTFLEKYPEFERLVFETEEPEGFFDVLIEATYKQRPVYTINPINSKMPSMA